MAENLDFRIEERATWCPGCGDYAVLAALQKACLKLELKPEEVVLVSGIGCSGKISQHFGSYGFHALHGRAIPVASGVQLANPSLKVITAGGDGDGYGIGFGHFVHAVRRNLDITYIVMDNHIYGLTTGQMSPTSKKGFVTKTSPKGSAEEPIHPLETAVVNGCSFVAQAFSGDVKQMTRIFEEGIRHKGFALINVFSPCVTFNKVNTYEWFKDNIYNLDDAADYAPDDRSQALQMLFQHQSVVTGLIYREEREAYHEAMLGGSETPGPQLDLNLRTEEKKALLAQFQ